MRSVSLVSPVSKKLRLRLRLIWAVLALAFVFFGARGLATGHTSIRATHIYSRESSPAMFWLIIATHFGMASWLTWKAATQRAEAAHEKA